MTSFISVCFSGRVNLKKIEEKTPLGGPGACFTWCIGLFGAF